MRKENISAAGSGGRAWARVALLCLAVTLPCDGGLSQQGNGQHSSLPPTTLQQQMPMPFGPSDLPMSPEAERRLNMINAARQKGLVDDTNKLLALATALNHEIAASNPGVLSAEQMHKVAEIEKLAHSVRDKMVMPIRAPGLNDNAPFSPYEPFGH